MPSTLEVSRPDQLAVRIDQLVTLTETGESRAHESYLTNQALLEDAAERTGSELGRDALATMREAGRHDYAAHLATVAAVRLEDRGEHADADAMQKEASARREIAAGMRSDPNPEPPAPEPLGGREWPRGYERRGSTMSGTNPDIIFEETRESVQPGGNDYSALRQQPTPAAVIEEEPQRPAGNVAAAELSQADEGASPLEATRPEETMTRGITVGIGPGGATILKSTTARQTWALTLPVRTTRRAKPSGPSSRSRPPRSRIPRRSTRRRPMRRRLTSI